MAVVVGALDMIKSVLTYGPGALVDKPWFDEQCRTTNIHKRDF